jgi:hypothetical protein
METDPIESAVSPLTLKLTAKVSLQEELQKNEPEKPTLERVLVLMTEALALDHVKPSIEVPFGRSNGAEFTCEAPNGALMEVIAILTVDAAAGIQADAKRIAAPKYRRKDCVGIFP